MLQEKCLILEAIRTVEERCHGKEGCTLQAAPDTLARGLRDPCPGVRYSAVQCSSVQYSTVQPPTSSRDMGRYRDTVT